VAGGIDWFRWHHGSVTDPKFGLIAKKAGVRVSDVIAMWAFVLETASADADRGYIGVLDFEAVDHLMGFDEGQALKIMDVMAQRGLIAESRITSWDKRQPKRERDTDNSAERTRAYRERQQAPKQADQNHVTPCDASDSQRNARGEERRVEEIEIQEPTVLVGLPPDGDKSAPPDRVVKLADRRIPCPADALLEAFHAECPTLPRVIKLNEKRRTHLIARWREVDADSKFSSSADGIEVFRGVFRKVNASDFLTGRAKSNGRSWSASFDWLFESSTNFLKVCEGRYDNESGRQADKFAGCI